MNLGSVTLWLAPYIRIVSGKRNWCVINLKRSDFILVNAEGGRILSDFENGKRVSDIIDSLKHSRKNYTHTIKFINDALSSGVLLDKPIKHNDNLPNDISESPLQGTMSLTIEITRQCNLFCLHCYNNSSYHHNDKLSLSMIRNILKESKNIFSNLKTITITGGEPLLHENLYRIIENTIETKCTKIRLNTNGILRPKRELLKILKEYSSLISIQITLLGASSETHDYVSNRKGSFNKTCENITYYKNNGLDIQIAFIKSHISSNETVQAYELANKLNVDIFFGDIHPIGRALDNYDKLILKNEKDGVDIPCDPTIYNGKKSGYITPDKINALREEFPPKMPCGLTTLAFSCNGDVLPCTLLQDIVLGNIFTESLKNIISSKIMHDFQDAISIEARETCSECELRYVCANKCPAVSSNFSDNLQGKNPFCQYY